MKTAYKQYIYLNIIICNISNIILYFIKLFALIKNHTFESKNLSYYALDVYIVLHHSPIHLLNASSFKINETNSYYNKYLVDSARKVMEGRTGKLNAEKQIFHYSYISKTNFYHSPFSVFENSICF